MGVEIRPTFTVTDWAAAVPIMKEFVALTRNEEGCLYYGWTRTGEDQLRCREAYVSGDAVNAHLANVGDCIGKLLAEGVAKLDSIEIHGPEAEVEKTKAGTSELGTKYYTTHSGFTRYSKAQKRCTIA